jgi:chemotaxis signal transduction protein
MLQLLSVRETEVSPVLVVMVGARACAFPLHHVAETMRPLPIKPVAGTPDFVCGVEVIRGAPTPVVDLKALLNKSENSTSFGRFVSLKFDDRHVAIGVDSVIGLRYLNSAQLGDLPPLLRDVTTDCLSLTINPPTCFYWIACFAARATPTSPPHKIRRKLWIFIDKTDTT